MEIGAFVFLYRRKLDLIGIKFHAAVACIKQGNFFDACMLVIDENLQVIIPQHVQIDFVPVISNPHHKRSVLIQGLNLVVQRKPFEVTPRNHA
jgi:hypothetical protein